MPKKRTNPPPTTLLDYGPLEGGLVRMMDRFRDEGTMTGDPGADRFLRADPNAALLGLLYDQRVRAEYAFTGPMRLRDRLGHLDMRRIARMDGQELRDAFSVLPAVHRFTNRMADYTHGVALALVRDWKGSALALWDDGADFETIRRRVEALPGFGPQKAAKMKYVLHYFGWRDFTGA